MGAVPPAFALPTDTTEAEGRVLSGGAAVNLNDILELAPAYRASPSEPGAGTAPLDLAVLDALNLQVGGVSLLGPNPVVGLGALQQYASANATTASAASGAVLANGAIDAGGAGVQQSAFVDVGALLGAVPAANGLIDDLRVDLGAVAATATNAGGVLTSDYLISGGDLVLTSPAVAALNADLTTALNTLSGTVDGLTAPTGAVDVALDGLEAGLLADVTALLDGLTLGALSVDGLAVDATLDVDLASVLASLPPLVDGPVEINLQAGTITIDLATATGAPGNTFNDLLPNTELIDGDALAALVEPGGAIASALNDLPAALVTAVQAALDAQVLEVSVTGTVALAGLDIVALDVLLSGTVGAFTGVPGATPPTVDGGGSTLLGGLIPLGTIVDPVVDLVTTTLLPAVVGAVDPLLSDVGLSDALFTPAVTEALTDLVPALDLVSGLVSITANVQETPGEFTTSGAFVTPDTFTQRAVTITLLPAFGALAEINLASATVRAPLLPAITSIAPAAGPETGGTVVTLTGTNFEDATGVTFDGIPGTDFAVVSPTTIEVTSPAHAPGPVDVVITDPAGPSLPATFNYLNVPGITGLDPRFGPEAGGTVVTVTGEGFTGATGVTFDGVPGTAFAVVDDSTIEVTSPAGEGVVDVVVEHPVAASPPFEFTYVAPGAPAVVGLAPDRGPETGGTTVVITGSGFEDGDGVTGVTFDGLDADVFTIDSDTQITAVSPAHAPGLADVIVSNAAGGSGPLDFTYFAVTSVDVVAPGAGPEDGGNTVTIIGDCFTDVTTVTFGGEPGTNVQVLDDNTITVTVPAGAPGLVDVVVVGVGECGPGTLPDAYEYLDEPVIATIVPDEGPETGGTVVTLTGTDFAGATAVTFGTVPATLFSVISDTEIQVTTPVNAPGVAAVTVTGPGGTSDPVDFTYLNVPSITALAPDFGPEDGGTVVTVVGEGFTGATGVTFDGVPGTGFTVVSDTEISVTSPEGEGFADVVVEHPVADSAPAQFVYVAPGAAVLSAIAPDRGPETGGTTVVITGSGFEAGDGVTGVTFGGVPATEFEVISDTQLTAVSPANVPGVANVVVSNEAGASAPLDFTYFAVTSVDDVEPGVGPETGGNTVIIVGDCFTGATGVSFGGVPAISFQVVSDTVISAVVPAGSSGLVDVVVAGAGECGPGTIEDGYEYTDDPIIWAITPSTGPETGGTVVVIDGANLGGVTGVEFGGVPAAEFTVVSDSRIIATTPAGAPGTVDVTLIAPYGISDAAAFTYLAVGGPGGGSGGATPPGASAGSGSGLPVTGAEVGGFAALAALLLALGAVAVVLARRRRAE